MTGGWRGLVVTVEPRLLARVPREQVTGGLRGLVVTVEPRLPARDLESGDATGQR